MKIRRASRSRSAPEHRAKPGELHAVKVRLTRPPLPRKRWEHFSHEANIGVRGFGTTIAAAFARAAVALTAVVVEPASVLACELVTVSCSAPDDQVLLADWLNAVLFEMASRKMLFGRFEVQVEAGELTASMWGEYADVDWYEANVKMKAATFTELQVCPSGRGGWLAQCVIEA